MRRRAPLHLEPDGTWSVDLPTFRMVPGSFQPVTAGLIDADGPLSGADSAQVQALNPTVEIELPDHTPLNPGGQIAAGRMRNIYREHARFGHSSWVPPRLS